MPPASHAIHALYLQLPPEDIALVKFVFESYEGVGVVRTVDRRTAVIVVLVVDDFLPVGRQILSDLQQMIACTEIEAPQGEADDWLMREVKS